MISLPLPSLDQLALAGFRAQIIRDNALVPLATSAYPLLPTGGIVAVGPSDPVVPRSILVTNLRLTRKRLGRETFNPDEFICMVYRYLPRAERGMIKGGRRIEEVELPLTTGAQRSLNGYFAWCISIDTSSPEQVDAFNSEVIELAEALAGGDLDGATKDRRAGTAEEPPRRKAARMLGASTVHDVTQRPNVTRLPLRFASANTALEIDERRLRGTRVALDARAAVCAHLMDQCVGKAEGYRQVSTQAVTSPYLRSAGGDRERERREKAISYWRDHADEMERIFFAPFAGYFRRGAHYFRQAANAAEQGDLVGAQQMMIAADVTLALVRVCSDVSELMLRVWPFVDEDIARQVRDEDAATMLEEISILQSTIPRPPPFLDRALLETQAIGLTHLHLLAAKPSVKVGMRELNDALHALEHDLEDIGDKLLSS